MSEPPSEFLCCLYCWRLSRESDWAANEDRCPSCRAAASNQHFWRTQRSGKGGSTRRMMLDRRYRAVRDLEVDPFS